MMWYSHKESGIAVDLSQVRFLRCFENAADGPRITFHFLDGQSKSEKFQDKEQMQEVFDEISAMRNGDSRNLVSKGMG